MVLLETMLGDRRRAAAAAEEASMVGNESSGWGVKTKYVNYEIKSAARPILLSLSM
jgi:hypothetical protein